MAAEYLASQFEELGYSVMLQSFTIERLSADLSGLTLDGPGPEEIEVIPLDGSSTGLVSGDLVQIGLGTQADIPLEGLAGKIAFVQRGLVTFQDKVNRAHDAGAIGVVVYNNQPGNFMGTLLNPGPIPAVAISREDGERIEVLIASGDIQATIFVVTEALESGNVISELPGPGNGVVILGAHYDTAPGVLGANDNASGTAALLSLAEELSQKSFPFTLRFISFGAEELGLLGSEFYVESRSEDERQNVQAMINLDAMGSGNSLRVLGTQALTDIVLNIGEQKGVDVARSAGLQGGSSDHASFLDAGIPAIMLFTDDFSRIHTPADTVEFIDPALLGDAVRLGPCDFVVELAVDSETDLALVLRNDIRPVSGVTNSVTVYGCSGRCSTGIASVQT